MFVDDIDFVLNGARRSLISNELSLEDNCLFRAGIRFHVTLHVCNICDIGIIIPSFLVPFAEFIDSSL